MANPQEFLEQPDNDFDFRALINKVTYHWPLFLFMIMVCLVIGNVYLRYTTPVYQANATLMIKGGKQNNYATKVIEDIDVFNNISSIENEIELLKSGPLIRKVVENLNLNMVYTTAGQIRTVDVFEHIPYKLLVFDSSGFLVGKEIILNRYADGTYLVQLPDAEARRVQKGERINEKWGSCEIQELPDRNLKGYYDTEVKLTIFPVDEIANDYISRLSLSQRDQNAAIIDLGLQDKVFKRACFFLDELFKVYGEASIKDKNIMAFGTIKFLDERLAVIRSEIDSVERRVHEFKVANKISDSQSELDVAKTGLINSEQELNGVELKLKLLDELSANINNGNYLQFMPSDFGIGDMTLDARLASYNEQLIERQHIASSSGASSPMLEQKDVKIKAARQSIITSISSLKVSFSKIKNQMFNLKGEYRNDLATLPSLKLELDKITRETEIKQQLYLVLLQKREEAALSYASTTSDCRIVENAGGDSSPVSPRRDKILLFALIAGFVIPLGYIFVKDAFNNKVIGLEMITKYTNAPLLGELSDHPDRNQYLVVTDNTRTTIAEQFRTIRTNLQFFYGLDHDKGRVTMITSSSSGEGKTFFAMNLANALAISGRKVLLIDLDLRKPKISRYLGIKTKNGITQYLAGLTSKEEILTPTDVHPNLFLIPSGTIPPNPSELLLAESFDQLIDLLKLEFDDVIIDTPPIGLVTDAQIISRKAQASIFVVRWGYTEKTWMPSIETLYRDKKLPNISIVFNGVRLGGRYGYSYGYGYDYGASKGYGYGYGHGKKYGYYDDEGNKKKSPMTILINLLKRI